ncbi:hypothetical protein V6615_05155 [Oscillospiraceae bacterium PP1C4]
MADYKKMYHILFHETATVIEQLQEAQRKAEEVYIESDDTPLTIVEDEQ